MVQDTFCTLPSAKDIKSKGTVIERHVAKCLSLFLFHLKLLFLLRLNKVAIKKGVCYNDHEEIHSCKT